MIHIEDGHGYEEVSHFPDLFVSKSKRESPAYIKGIGDYFAGEARRQYAKNMETFVRNYMFMKGSLTKEDFYEDNLDPETQQFIGETLDFDYERDGLPKDIVHYSIVNQPVNTLLGELQNKPDNFFVRAFDDMSRSEQLEAMTSIVERLMYTQFREKMLIKFAEEGADINSEEFMQQLEQVTAEKVEEELSNFTTLYERWGNRMLEVMKVMFNIKQLSEDSFADLLKTGRERYHIYEDNSELGFNIKNVNPRNIFRIRGSESKYTKDDAVTGIIEIMDISEIINTFSLTKRDVDRLRKGKELDKHTSKGGTGINSISYNAKMDFWKDQLAELDAPDVFEEVDILEDFLMNDKYYHNNRYQVVTTYIQAKPLIGKLTYIDADGVEQVDYVDENYKSGDHPQQIDLEWRYYNKWYKHVNIANILYSYEPVEFIDRNPIIGGDFDPRNSEVKGFLDLMKPFQMIYTVAINQIWQIMKKDLGIQYRINPRKIPGTKDGDPADALDDFEYIAKNKGLLMEDDSPENMGTPSPTNAASAVVDLSRHNEINVRWQLAQQMKYECWELVGITRERLGSVAASQTAQGANISMSQSYSQTSPWFAHHYYILNDLYQTILDAAQYFESQKEESTISNISGSGEHLMIKVAGKDLKSRDLRVFVTDRNEDHERLQRNRSFATEMLQNGVDAYDVSVLMDQNSIRAHQDVLLKIKKHRQEMEQEKIQIERERNESIQQQTQMLQQIEQEKLQRDDINKELDRRSRERVAVINTYSRQASNTVDGDNNGTPDIMDIMNDARQQDKLSLTKEIASNTQASNERMSAMKMNMSNRQLEFERKAHEDKMKQMEEERKSRERLKKADIGISKRNKN